MSFVEENFVSYGPYAIADIHRGRNRDDPSKNNPHVHIIVPTRTVGEGGFCRWKDREHDKRQHINIWRERWAQIQNHAYERNHLDIRVSHESLEVQGRRDREPTIRLSRIDYQKEQRGERTPAGDRKRAIEERNRERGYQRQLAQEKGGHIMMVPCATPEVYPKPKYTATELLTVMVPGRARQQSPPARNAC